MGLRSGASHALAIEPGRDCDSQPSLQAVALTPGSLRITALGDCDPAVFPHRDRPGVFGISRLQCGTAVVTPEGPRWPWLDGRAQQPGPFVERPIRLGTERTVACRVVAWRVPAAVANRRRQTRIAEARRKDDRVPSKERRVWWEWTILVTNVAAEWLTPREIAVLSRARGQSERLCQRWKSLGLIAERSGSTVARRMVRLGSRLVAVLVQHWLLPTGVWDEPRSRLARAGEAIRRHGMMLAVAIGDPTQRAAEIARLGVILRVTAKQNVPVYRVSVGNSVCTS